MDECAWSWAEDKRFEVAVATCPEDCPYRWERIASAVGGKSVEEIKRHYHALVEDVRVIELGLIEVPTYLDDDGGGGGGGIKRRSNCKWTEKEHRLFVEGVEKYGKGNWKSVARLVGSRDATQVASHAQKYYLRLNSTNKKRSSIHDITTAGAPPPPTT